ncbi:MULTISPECIES: hypothetical protein [Pseudomonas]|uniref:hypothetical protein n=1 Tax=Pseudomonas TaxID=286 RepID=UPI000412C36A|nr:MULTISPECIES: hypothetical protein [Pseudomonas]MBR7519890.1 hypothetical protein [Pseudomonas juntendi]
MCDCRQKFEQAAVERYPEITGAKATLQGYMLIPAGRQYAECEVVGTRTTAKGKEIKAKATINVLGSYCMFCGEKHPEAA